MNRTVRILFLILIFYSALCLLIWYVWTIPDVNRLNSVQDERSKSSISVNIDIDSYCDVRYRRHSQCYLLTSASDHYRKPALNHTEKIPAEMYDNCALEYLAQNCSHLRRYHGYAATPMSEEEKNFPLAFAIKLHDKPEQAEQLLRTIYMPQNIYCIHVDNKAKTYVFDTLKYIADCFDNVILVEHRVEITYGADSLIEAEFKCMYEVWNSNIKWKYYINLTGKEFPLRTNYELVTILKSFNGANDIESYPFPAANEWRVKYEGGHVGGIFWRGREKKPFKYKIELRKGSAYGMFSRRFVEFILKDDIARGFLAWSKGTLSPEEMVWATLNALPWAPGGYDVFTKHDNFTHASRVVLWEWDNATCHGTWVRSVCVYAALDLPMLSSRPELFANKFDSSIDTVPIDCLENFLRKKREVPNLSKLNWHYYSHLPHVQIYNSFNNSEHTIYNLDRKKQQWLKDKLLA